jgi:hypothetical protein
VPSFDSIKEPLNVALLCAQNVAFTCLRLFGQGAFPDEATRAYRDLPHLVKKTLLAFTGNDAAKDELRHHLEAVNEDAGGLVKWACEKFAKLEGSEETTVGALVLYGGEMQKARAECQRKVDLVLNSCQRAREEANRIRLTTNNAVKNPRIADIFERQHESAKRELQEQQDAEAKANDQAALTKLWESVRYHAYASGQYKGLAHEWVSLISTLTNSLSARGLMDKLNEPPAGLGEWAEAEGADEPDGYHLAVEIYRQSIIDPNKAASLLLEAARLPIWRRVNAWLRHDLHQHVEGRWAVNHPLPRKPIDRPLDEFLTAKLPDNRADLLASCAALRKRVNGENYSLRAAALRDAPTIVARLWQSVRFIAEGEAVPVEPDNIRRLKGEYAVVGDEIGQNDRDAAIRTFNAAIDTVIAWCKTNAAAKSNGKNETVAISDPDAPKPLTTSCDALGIKIDHEKKTVSKGTKKKEFARSEVQWHIFNVALAAYPAAYSLESMRKDYPGVDDNDTRKSAITELNKKLKPIGLRIQDRRLCLISDLTK